MAFVVYSYAGFGDHCSCYAIFKEFSKTHDKIIARSDFMSETAFNNTKRLYASLPNVELDREPATHGDTFNYMIAYPRYWFDSLSPWLNDPNLPLTKEIENNIEQWYFDYIWYKDAGIPFNLMWDNFYIERNLQKEKEIYYDVLGLKDNEEFVFFHEDPARKMGERNFACNKDWIINKNIKIIELFKLNDISLIDLTYTIEKSQEIHTFNSGVAIFIDLMKIKNTNLYYHHYARPSIFWRPTLKLPWTTIKNENK